MTTKYGAIHPKTKEAEVWPNIFSRTGLLSSKEGYEDPRQIVMGLINLWLGLFMFFVTPNQLLLQNVDTFNVESLSYHAIDGS